MNTRVTDLEIERKYQEPGRTLRRTWISIRRIAVELLRVEIRLRTLAREPRKQEPEGLRVSPLIPSRTNLRVSDASETQKGLYGENRLFPGLWKTI